MFFFPLSLSLAFACFETKYVCELISPRCVLSDRPRKHLTRETICMNGGDSTTRMEEKTMRAIDGLLRVCVIDWDAQGTHKRLGQEVEDNRSKREEEEMRNWRHAFNQNDRNKSLKSWNEKLFSAFCLFCRRRQRHRLPPPEQHRTISLLLTERRLKWKRHNTRKKDEKYKMKLSAF